MYASTSLVVVEICVFLDDADGDAGLYESVCGHEACWACTDDEDVDKKGFVGDVDHGVLGDGRETGWGRAWRAEALS